MRNFITIEEKGSVREFIISDLNNTGLRIDTNKHRNVTIGQTSPHISNNLKHQRGTRVFNIPLHQMDTISIRIDDFDLTIPIFLRWCFDCIRRSIKNEGLFRKSGGSQRVKELMARIEDGCLTPNLSTSNTVFDICSLFKEFLRRLTYPLITYPIQDLLLDCFSMRTLSSDKKLDIYINILLLLPDEHLHVLIYILRFLYEITLNERDNKMNAKNLAICVGPGIMRTSIDGKINIMTEQCATNVSDIVEILIINAMKIGYVTDSIYERSQMLLEMRQKEIIQNNDDSFAIENGIRNGIGGGGGGCGKINDQVNAKKRRSGSVKEFLVHMTNRFRRRSGSNNESRDQTNAFLDRSGKLSSSHTREHRYHYQQNSINGHCLSSSSTSNTTTKRKSSDDPNGGNSKRGKTKTSSQEKISLPNTNRFTSPITAFRRKKKTSNHNNDPGFPFKIEHSHLPQLLHFTDEVPVRFMNTIVNPTISIPSSTTSSSSLSTTTPSGSMTTLTTSMMSNVSLVHGTTILQPLSIIPPETQPTLLPNLASISCNNKSLDTKKLNLLDSWKWPKSTRKVERKPLIAIHAPMLTTSIINSSSFTESSPSPIKPTDNSMQISTQQIAGTSLLMHSSFGIHRRHSDDVTSTSFTTTTFRPRRSISSSAGQQQTRHVICMLNNHSHSLTSQQQITIDDHQQIKHNLTQEHEDDSFNDDDDDISNELNLAVVVGNEDIQSLKEYPNEQINNEHGSLDVAFIDETDLERNISHNKQIYDNDQILIQSNNINIDILNIKNNENEIKINNQNLNRPILIDKILNNDNNLEEILRRNENRCIRLTDSDDEDHENFHIKKTPVTNTTNDIKLTTPKIPVRLSSSISNLTSSSNNILPSSISKERSLSCSITTQSSNDLFHTLNTKSISLNLGENDENVSLHNSGRESVLILKDKLAGRVHKQVCAFEHHSSSEKLHNQSITSSVTSKSLLKEKNDNNKNRFTVTLMNTPEQRIIEEALIHGNKIILSGTRTTGHVARSVKRLQNSSIRRWKGRTKELEKHHQSSSPYRLLNKKKN
ncbi:unnamed protein product [Rotaria sordida]|uniref:Rho-GAP domain-containing protein n=1 Tax=Rotaria sordida TaxID=392033 RepID=A0A813RD52_9BILA|nr:unnamed protein product [Rotaria sordida]CAF0855542.1 unnamed protein product [Rotaria sordida]